MNIIRDIYLLETMHSSFCRQINLKHAVVLLLFVVLPDCSANIPEILGSIQTTFAKGADPEVVLGIAFFALSLIGVLVLNEIRKADARERARAKISWDAFYKKSAEIGLTTAEIKLLESLVIESRLANADSLMTSAQVFENARETYYDSQGGITFMDDAELHSFRDIRSRLGFSPLPVETPYTTTRQFIPGLRVIVEIPDLSIAATAQVEDVDERRWVLNNPFDRSVDIRPGMRARLSMTRGGDAEYGIETEVDETKDFRISFKHTRRLLRRQLRNWVRIDVNIPVTAVIPAREGDARPPLPMKGRVVDLSGGGVALRLPVQLQVGSSLLIDFQLNETMMLGILVEIIRVAPIRIGEEQLFQHSVSFKDLPKTSQERIVRYVFEKQRQDAQWR